MTGRRRAARRGLAAMTMLGAVAFATPAAAEDCLPLEPTCVVDTVDDVIGDVVDDTTDTVDDVTGAAEDTVDDIVTGVDDTVGDLSGEGVDSDPGGDGGGGKSDRNDGSVTSSRRGSAPAAVRPLGLRRSSVALPDVGPVARPESVERDRPVGGAASTPLATGMAMLSFLLALMIGFVAFQHTLDRGDPKLAPETLGPDLVPFA